MAETKVSEIQPTTFISPERLLFARPAASVIHLSLNEALEESVRAGRATAGGADDGLCPYAESQLVLSLFKAGGTNTLPCCRKDV